MANDPSIFGLGSAKGNESALPFPDPALRDGPVELRPWLSSDAPLLAVSDAALLRFMSSHPQSESDARDWLERAELARHSGRGLELVIADAEDGSPLGGVTLWSLHLRHRSANVNYWVAADARRRGVATRALRLLARWSFDSLSLARLQLFVDPQNAASQRVAERCGFVLEGTLRSHMEHAGRRHDSLVYGLLEGDQKPSTITLLVASVYEEQQYHSSRSVRRSGVAHEQLFEVRTRPGTHRVGLRVVLSAVLRDGQMVTADTPIGISGSLSLSRSEVNEQLDRLLGRDPHLRRPPRLAWGPLIAALESVGVNSSEAELIASPLEMRFEPSTDGVVAPD